VALPPDPDRRRGLGWQERIVTVLLVVAALGTSWSSYQAMRWNGEQAKAASTTNAIRIQAARDQGQAQAQTEVDVATFIAWADADQQGDHRLADFYMARFRPEFQPAFNVRMATKPLSSPNAPPNPFAMPEYTLQARSDAEELDAASEASAAQVRQTSSDRPTTF
jgi:hypothetical protein